MSSIRQKNADNRIATARQMTEGAGYNYDWGSFYDGVAPPEPDELPAFCFIDPDESLDFGPNPLMDRVTYGEFKGMHSAPEPQDQYPTARRMIEDIERNQAGDFTVGGLAVTVQLARASIFAEYPTSDRVTVVIPFELRYRTTLTDPSDAR